MLLLPRPIPATDLGEFFAMADFVNAGILGNLATFRRVFQTPIERSMLRTFLVYEMLPGCVT